MVRRGAKSAVTRSRAATARVRAESVLAAAEGAAVRATTAAGVAATAGVGPTAGTASAQAIRARHARRTGSTLPPMLAAGCRTSPTSKASSTASSTPAGCGCTSPRPAPAAPLLLVHGWPQHWYEWRGLVAELKGERRLIMPDLRGFGWSDAPSGPIEPEVFVRDLLALLDALELEQVDVVGHDWGGFSSLLLSARHPERVRRLLAVSTPHPWLKVTPRLGLETWRAWYAALFAAGLMQRDNARLAAWFMRREGVSAEDVEVFAAPLREPARAAATTRLYRAYLRTVVATARGSNPPSRARPSPRC